MSLVSEPTTIGLSERTHGLLKRLKADQHFAEMVDAYRLGIALALAEGVLPDDPPTPRATIFSVATLDPERELGTAISSLIDVGDIPVYRWAERLAEWGVKELAIRADSGDLDVSLLINQQE